MIQINSKISIQAKELKFDFLRASGPGGQNVNKVETAVLLRFDLQHSSSLPVAVRERLIFLAGNRITEQGILMIKAARFRTQLQNRRDAINRLIGLIKEASIEPKIRRKTKRSITSKKRILEAKRHRSMIKKMRRRIL